MKLSSRLPRVRAHTVVCLGLAAALALGGYAQAVRTSHAGSSSSPSASAHARPAPDRTYVAPPFRDPLPGMPPVIDNDVYSQTRAGMLSPAVRGARAYLNVPDSQGNRVTVIDQRTRKIVRVIP